jgi:hypothetical protein
MIRNNADEPTDAPHGNHDRLAQFTTGEVFVVYETDNSRAWLESDSVLDLEEMV